MGFFSSRRAEPEPLPKSAQQTSPITSRWYGKLKRKNTGHLEGFRSSPELPVAAPLEPRASSRPVSMADPTTVDLAARLNELATSNADGLISDEEYRVLRQDIFERFGSKDPMTTSTVSGSQRTAKGPSPFSRAPIPSYSPPDPASTPSKSHSPSPISSLRSSLRRMGSRSSTDQSIAGLDSSAASVFSFRSRTTVTMAQSGMNTSTHTLLSQPSSGIHRPADLLSVSSHRSKGSVAPSHRSRGPPPSSYNNPMPSSSSVRQTLPDNETEKTAAQLRRELGEVETEGRRVLQGFDALETKLIEQAEGLGLGIRLPRPSNSHPREKNAAPSTIRPRKRTSLVDLVSFRSPAKSTSSPAPDFPPSSYTSPIQTATVLAAMQPDPEFAASLDDVRKSRADVRQRYDARIAFLRAKLRGAELHEKLIR